VTFILDPPEGSSASFHSPTIIHLEESEKEGTFCHLYAVELADIHVQSKAIESKSTIDDIFEAYQYNRSVYRIHYHK
jgi:hypothetical protein